MVCLHSGGSSQPHILTTSIIWLNALFWSLTPLSPIGWGRYAIEPPKSTCMLDFANREPSYMMYLFLMTSTVYALPVGAILWCLVKLRKGKDPNNGKSKVTMAIVSSNLNAKGCRLTQALFIRPFICYLL